MGVERTVLVFLLELVTAKIICDYVSKYESQPRDLSMIFLSGLIASFVNVAIMGYDPSIIFCETFKIILLSYFWYYLNIFYGMVIGFLGVMEEQF